MEENININININDNTEKNIQKEEKNTEIVFILDKSGSMWSIKDDAIGGFNTFISEQKKLDGDVKVSLILFDSNVETVYESKNVHNIEDLNENTFLPSGMTAMLDAIGLGIDGFNKRMSNKKLVNNIIFAIMTDGHENSSREYDKNDVERRIKRLQEENDYQFIFLGANIDAVSTAFSLGINKEYAGQFVAKGDGVSVAMMNASSMVRSYCTDGVMSTYSEIAEGVANSAVKDEENNENNG